MLTTVLILLPGVWTAPVATENGELWIHHIVFQHPGLVAFVGVDMVILLAALSLTIAQATQVNYLCKLD